MPPSGQSTIRFAIPPTERHANAWPYSCSKTIKNRQRYSMMFQVMEEYLPERLLLISYAATRNHDQCRKTSTPAAWKRWKEPERKGGMVENHNTPPLRAQVTPSVGRTFLSEQGGSLFRRNKGGPTGRL